MPAEATGEGWRILFYNWRRVHKVFVTSLKRNRQDDTISVRSSPKHLTSLLSMLLKHEEVYT